ncbi:lysis system i-spanin subunit Rz [Pseudomonas sp. MYb118]|uniref:lysis system i-spanin subunit Rz n=1 Tax=Pseudomonas sp. MYb118 TaxID=1848720 RepID=UPI0034CE4C2B
MRFSDLIPPQYRMFMMGAAVLVVAGCFGALAWQVQDWRYGQKLEQQARLHVDTLNQLALAAAAQQRTERDNRFALEQRLSANEQTHYRALNDAQRDQDRLRDRLATADVRLSVLLAAKPGNASGSVPATTAGGGVVHGPARAELDPAHAQRIIGITDDGDTGLMALRACQNYVELISRP